MNTLNRQVSAPHGATLTGNRWLQEAALEMLMHNRDRQAAGAQIILDGAYEACAAVERKHVAGDRRGCLTVTAQLGGTAGVQSLAVTMNGGVAAAVDLDPQPIACRLANESVHEQGSSHDTVAFDDRPQGGQQRCVRWPRFVPEYMRPLFRDGHGRSAGGRLPAIRQSSPQPMISRSSCSQTNDGSREADEKLERVLTCDPGIGVVRYPDAGYPEAVAGATRAHTDMPISTPGGAVR